MWLFVKVVEKMFDIFGVIGFLLLCELLRMFLVDRLLWVLILLSGCGVWMLIVELMLFDGIVVWLVLYILIVVMFFDVRLVKLNECEVGVLVLLLSVDVGIW